MKTIGLLLSIVGLASSCFCPQIISPSCGCGGGASYSPYYGGGGGGYASAPYSSPNYNYSPAQPVQGSYAIFYRDLTPFRQPYYNPRPMYPPQGPPKQLPPMYSLPNPRLIRPQPPVPQQQPPMVVRPAPIRVTPAVYVPPVTTTQAPVHDGQIEYEEEEVYDVTTTYAPPSPVYTPTTTYAPVVYTTTPYTTTTQSTVVVTTAIPAVQDEVEDFEDTTETKKPENKKDDFYYVYYDEKGNKVGDSRSGTTFAPQDIVNEVTTAATVQGATVTALNVVKSAENYDDVVVEQTAKVEKIGDVVYEDETVEYEDGTTAVPKTTMKQSKRGLGDNQIMVSAADNVGEEIGYRRRLTAKGVKTITKERADRRKIHSN